VIAPSTPESIVALDYHGNGTPTTLRLELIRTMCRHVAVDDFVVLDRDKELVLTLHVAAVELEEVDHDRFLFQFLGIPFDEEGILREGVVLE
jgi:hypothetical protein